MVKVILAGNPNTGKTTLFNTMTKADEHASNWHGVTVDVKEKKYKFHNEEFTLCDLPGIYSLDAISKEEKIASKYLDENEGVIVCLTDANNLKRNLYLALELKEKYKNVVIAVNMAKEVKTFDAKKLSEILNVNVIGIDARKKKSVNVLKQVILDFSKQLKKNDKLEKKPNKAFNIKEFEAKSKARYEKIDNLLKKSGYQTSGFYGQSKADKILLNPVLSFIIFAFVMLLVFFITFGPIGSFLSDAISYVFQLLKNEIITKLESFIYNDVVLGFIEEGVLGGILTVLSFMPQVILLFICLNFLEDIGYLSRVAFMFDGVFKKFGLTGRSVFSLIMGLGCTTTAIITTRNLNSKSLRKRTGLMLPFMSCSAKLPIYAVICSAFFSKYKALMVFLLYMLAIVIMLIVSLVLKFVQKEHEEEMFILEMPKYRFPYFKKIISGAMQSAKSFLIRVGGVLLLSSMIIFLLYNFSFKFTYVTESGESMLGVIAKNISFIFTPLGFASAGAVVGIMSGIIAKEMVVSSLAIVNSTTLAGLGASLVDPSSSVFFTTASSLSFLVFVLLYPTCISAMVSMKKELGVKTTFLSILIQFVTAYVASMLIYFVVNLIEIGLWWISVLIIIFVALFVFFVLKYLCRRYNLRIKLSNNGCSNCKEKCYGDNKLSRKRC